jgi:hypothetical protein
LVLPSSMTLRRRRSIVGTHQFPGFSLQSLRARFGVESYIN